MSENAARTAPAPPRDPGVTQFLVAIAQADAVLNQQRELLHKLDPAARVDQASMETASMLSALKQHSDEVQRTRMLSLTLDEIHRRQKQIDTAVSARLDQAIALEAYEHAMHRIRTSLDVALGCVEEIMEVSEPDALAATSALEASKEIRLVYCYANELSEMASIGEVSEALTDYSSSEGLQSAVKRVARTAADAGIEITLDLPEHPSKTHGDLELTTRTLAYLLLMAIVSSGVRAIAASVRTVTEPTGEIIEYRIEDDGRGLDLQSRAQTGTEIAMRPHGAKFNWSDAAGFALARRYAKLLGGHIELETAANRGSVLLIRVPVRRKEAENSGR